MSVTRVNELFAKPVEIPNLKRFLCSIGSELRTAKGCSEFRILECETEPNRFVIIETWDSAESHQEAVQQISEQAVQKAREMLEATPDGNYYVELTC